MKLLLSALLVLSSLSAIAAPADESFVVFCGSRSELNEFARRQGQPRISKADMDELIEQRSPILDILQTGDEGIDRMLEAGSESDTGPFGALMACGVIDKYKALLKSKGCVDLKTNKVVRNSGGVEACSRMIKALKKRQH